MAIDESALRAAFTDFIQTPPDQHEPAEVCQLLVKHTLAVLGGDGAGVALLQDGRLTIVASHRAVGLEVDTGPGDMAVTGRRLVASADLATESRWPCFRRVTLEGGLRAVASIPLVHQDRSMGVLEAYWGEAHGLDDDERRAARLLADLGAGRLATLQALTEARELAGQLQHALDSRVVVEQAKGMLAERHDLEPDVAYEAIRAYARRHNRTVHTVAEAVLAGRLAVV